MGKGDRKTGKGKLFKGTYGKSRPRPGKAGTTTAQATGSTPQ